MYFLWFFFLVRLLHELKKKKEEEVFIHCDDFYVVEEASLSRLSCSAT